MLIEQPLQVLAVVAIIIVGKSLAAIALVLAFRYPLNTALTVGASLAQIGEFSFILAGLGVSLGLLPAEGPEPDPGRRPHLHRAQPARVRGDRAGQRWLRQRSQLARRPGAPRRSARRAAR